MSSIPDFAGVQAGTARDQKKARRRMPVPRSLIAWALVALAVGAGWERATRPNANPLTTVRWAGNLTTVDPEALAAAVHPWLGRNFFLLPLDRIRAAIAAVPWVDHAEVQRVWPYGLVITVTQTVPVAQWAGGGWINSHGVRVRLGGRDTPVGLPLLRGPEGSEPMVYARWLALAPRFTAAGLPIARLALSERGGWRIDTASGVTVVAGHQDVTARVARLLALWPQLIASGHTDAPKRIDLRYGNGFAVVWTPASTPAGGA